MGRDVAVSRRSARPRRRAAAALGTAASALALTACGGSGAHFANRQRPPVPVDLSVYVDDHHVSVSPAKVGAGPVIFYITNQGSGSENVKIKSSKGRTVRSSGAINSGQTAQINADLRTGRYDIAAGTAAAPARLKITGSRANADNVLLQP